MIFFKSTTFKILLSIISFILISAPGAYNDWNTILNSETGILKKTIELLNAIFNNFFFFIFLSMLVLFYFIYFLINKYQKLRGVRGVKVKLLNLMRRHKHGLIDYIYRFDQTVKSQIIDIDNLKKGTNLDDIFRSKLIILLNEIEVILSYIGVRNCSLNIKVFLDNENKIVSRSEFSKYSIHTLVRKISSNENEKYHRNLLSPRRNIETYNLCKHYYNPSNDNLVEWVSKLKLKFEEEFNCELNSKNYFNGNGKKINSAFNYVLGNNSHYFLSNDLDFDIKQGFFFTNSNNFEQYYNSLGVFLIHQQFSDRNNQISISDPYGYLILDSIEKNLFDNKFISKLMLHFSQRINELFECYNNNEKK